MPIRFPLKLRMEAFIDGLVNSLMLTQERNKIKFFFIILCVIYLDKRRLPPF